MLLRPEHIYAVYMSDLEGCSTASTVSSVHWKKWVDDFTAWITRTMPIQCKMLSLTHSASSS